MENDTPSPIRISSLPLSRKLLRKQLKELKLPEPVTKQEGGCHRECHILERNHTLELVQRLVK